MLCTYTHSHMCPKQQHSAAISAQVATVSQTTVVTDSSRVLEGFQELRDNGVFFVRCGRLGEHWCQCQLCESGGARVVRVAVLLRLVEAQFLFERFGHFVLAMLWAF